MTSPANVQATWCATLVEEWVRGGVAHAVVSPGSRSTPLALALAAEPRLAVHVHHDERAAAFLALGIGRGTGRPAVVLTTSGTAAAHLHPAVIEASYSQVPMLVCTADRPPELQSVGAPQTIDQSHLYGRAVRWFAEPGVADEAVAASWRSLAARAVLEATGVRPGPVHLNLAFREPLVGEPAPLPTGRDGGAPWHAAAPARPAADAALAPWLRGRGVLVAGGGVTDGEAVHRLASALGWPVLADPRSAARSPRPATVAAFDALLRHAPFADAHRPDVVVRLGEAPASKVLGQWLASAGARELVVAGTWLDPARTAATVVEADPSAWCAAVLGSTGEPADAAWRASWADAEARVQAVLAEHLDRGDELTEPALARAVAGAAGDGPLVVASSMPVRDVEWYAAPRVGPPVVANRGANGIDGVVSTAAGVALAGDRPVTALVGDVAFLHDANALLGLADRPCDLRVVVVDNRGGGIFSFLPQAAALPADRFEQLFGTPHRVDLVGLAQAFGVPATRVTRRTDLLAALAEPGARVVVAQVPDRAANVAAHEALHAAVAAALG